MTTIYLSDQQKRQLADFLKKYPCMIFVASCLERKLQKVTLEQNQKYQWLDTEIQQMRQVCHW